MCTTSGRRPARTREDARRGRTVRRGRYSVERVHLACVFVVTAYSVHRMYILVVSYLYLGPRLVHDTARLALVRCVRAVLLDTPRESGVLGDMAHEW